MHSSGKPPPISARSPEELKKLNRLIVADEWSLVVLKPALN